MFGGLLTELAGAFDGVLCEEGDVEVDWRLKIPERRPPWFWAASICQEIQTTKKIFLTS